MDETVHAGLERRGFAFVTADPTGVANKGFANVLDSVSL